MSVEPTLRPIATENPATGIVIARIAIRYEMDLYNARFDFVIYFQTTTSGWLMPSI